MKQVLLVDVHVLISVRSLMLVPETDHVTNFMNSSANLKKIYGGLWSGISPATRKFDVTAVMSMQY